MEILGCLDISPTWILGIAVLFLVYAYGKKRNRLFKDTGIPGPEPVIYLGNVHQFVLRRPSSEELQKYGKVYGLFIGGLPMIIVMDPSVAKDILIKEFHHFPERLNFDLSNYPFDKSMFMEKGANWKRLRNSVSPTFSGAKLRLMCDQINQCANILTNNFVKAAESNQSIDVKSYFGAFTMDAITTTAFGIEVDSQSDFKNVFVEQARKLLPREKLSPIILMACMFPELTPLFKAFGASTFSKSSLKFFTKVLNEMIEQRKADVRNGKKKRQDFFQLLMDAEDDGTDDHPSQSGSSSKKMTNDEIIGQALLFIIAGYSGTSKTLHFVAYALATNPDVQQRLTEEVDSVLGEKAPDYDNIGRLKYMDHVITETLRMYPSSTILSRKVAETVTIKGFTFPKGASIHIPVMGMHYDADVYPDPLSFNPDRWERKSEMDPMNFLPFGHGPRQCVGMRLAQMEMKMALARVLQKIKFVPAEDTLTLGIGDLIFNTGTLATKKPILLKTQVRPDK